MLNESTDRAWFAVLKVLPFPAAILDSRCRYVLLNRASAGDPILGRSRVGAADLDCCDGEPALQERVRARHRQYERSLRAGVPGCFEEEVELAAGQRHHVLWLCLPMAEEAGLAVVGFDVTATDFGISASQGVRVGEVNKALRVPLATLVAVAGSLVSDLSGAERERAALIEQSGQELLRRLDSLLGWNRNIR